MLATAGVMAVTMCLTVVSQAQTSISHRGDDVPTPTVGESWINHLHRSFGETSMGKTLRLGPAPADDTTIVTGRQLGFLPSSEKSVQLSGADLYRLNCQGCHGPDGQGAPPEIHSVINPVRATSASLLIERMKKTGMDISPSTAAQMAKQAQDALLQRIHNGGESMPAFPHLDAAEVRALVAYLKQLSGVPGAARFTATESPERIGEHIVKSTCHTCHDATGPNPTPQELENGSIPPLERLPDRVDELQLINKVTNGAPILMGTPPTMHRGRMPVFYYLSRDEAADVYLYLTSYPPQLAQATVSAAIASPESGSDALPPPAAVAPSGARPAKAASTSSNGISDWAVTFVLIAAGTVVMGLVFAGLGFAVYELQRLSRESERRRGTPAAPKTADRPVGDVVTR